MARKLTPSEAQEFTLGMMATRGLAPEAEAPARVWGEWPDEPLAAPETGGPPDNAPTGPSDP